MVDYSEIVFNEYRIIHIIPLGDVDVSMLNDIGATITKIYGYRCVVDRKIKPDPSILAKSKIKYDGNKILCSFAGVGHNLVITNLPIVQIKNGVIEQDVWGLSFYPGYTSVVSTNGLDYGDNSLLTKRVIKVCLHEIGHNIGIGHCNNNQKCVMNDGDRGLKELDVEEFWLCDYCKRHLKK